MRTDSPYVCMHGLDTSVSTPAPGLTGEGGGTCSRNCKFTTESEVLFCLQAFGNEPKHHPRAACLLHVNVRQCRLRGRDTRCPVMR